MIVIWKYSNIKRFIASSIWNFSEYTGIPLGKYAVSVFNAMMGSKGKKS